VGYAPTNNAPSLVKLKYDNYKLVELCQFSQCQGINRETKLALTITPGEIDLVVSA